MSEGRWLDLYNPQHVLMAPLLKAPIHCLVVRKLCGSMSYYTPALSIHSTASSIARLGTDLPPG